MNSKPVSILLISIWFGLVTGLGEVSILAFRKFYQGRPIFYSHHFFWMVPFADVIVFLIAGLILYLVLRRLPEKKSLQIAVSILAFMSFLSWFLMISRLHILASLILGVGLAIQTMRVITSHSDKFYTLVRLTIGLAGSLVILVAALMMVFVP